MVAAVYLYSDLVRETDYRDHHSVDHLNTPPEPYNPSAKRMGCMWETAGDMGCPLGRSPIPRYLAQHLALVPRAHKAHSGRKVSNLSARPVLNRFFPSSHTFDTAMATCLMTLKLIHATVPVPRLRAEGRRGFLFRETRMLRQRGNLLIPQRLTREFMLGPFCTITCPLSAHIAYFIYHAGWMLDYR